MKWFSKLRNKVILLMPTLAVYLIYIIVPIFIAIYYSFTKYSGIGQPKEKTKARKRRCTV